MKTVAILVGILLTAGPAWAGGWHRMEPPAHPKDWGPYVAGAGQPLEEWKIGPYYATEAQCLDGARRDAKRTKDYKDAGLRDGVLTAEILDALFNRITRLEKSQCLPTNDPRINYR